MLAATKVGEVYRLWWHLLGLYPFENLLFGGVVHYFDFLRKNMEP